MEEEGRREGGWREEREKRRVEGGWMEEGRGRRKFRNYKSVTNRNVRGSLSTFRFGEPRLNESDTSKL